MTDISTRIEITGRVVYSDEITIAQAAQIISFLNSSGSSPDSLGTSADQPGSLGARKQAKANGLENAREALDISGAKKNPEKIVALAAYVLQDGGETFKVEDVKTQFRRARETAPANFSRDMSAAIASGWIAEADPGEYYLTNKVSAVLDGGFTFPKASNGGRARTTKKAAAKSAVPETLAGIDAFHPMLDGYPPYSKMKLEKDRLLWVVLYMKEMHGRDGLSNKEISYISDRIGTPIPSGNVNAAFRAAKNPGYAYKSTSDNSIRVTDSGAEYVKAVGTKAEV
ncbi:hypothetical protein ACFVU2_02920 [Leifsonia sp. NPDC058194]|uniref:hypothetical protein n=1 Tax=Leifsonia sp. NPDC058194 TaxID=3346374 RepID=UPI0036DBFEDB